MRTVRTQVTPGHLRAACNHRPPPTRTPEMRETAEAPSNPHPQPSSHASNHQGAPNARNR